ncbi:MAG: hypothetical protein ACREX8_03605 [Gammaproteobacteria bacterium]
MSKQESAKAKRVQEGALSPLSTPQNPPAQTTLVPLTPTKKAEKKP